MPLHFTDNRAETSLIDRRLSIHSCHGPFSVAGVRALSGSKLKPNLILRCGRIKSFWSRRCSSLEVISPYHPG